MTLTKYIISESTKATHFSISNIEIFIKDAVQDPEVSVNRVVKAVVSKIHAAPGDSLAVDTIIMEFE